MKVSYFETGRYVSPPGLPREWPVPAGSYNPRFGTTVSLPSIVGRQGVIEVLEPAMSDEEKQGLELSAARLKETVRKYLRAS